MGLYTEQQKKHRNFNNSIKYGKQSNYFFSLNNKFLLQHKVLVTAPEFYHYTYKQFHCLNVRRDENCIFCTRFLLRFSIEWKVLGIKKGKCKVPTHFYLFTIFHIALFISVIKIQNCIVKAWFL